MENNSPTFVMFQPEDVRFVKQILIGTESHNDFNAIGYIMYQRQMSHTYKLRGMNKENPLGNLNYPVDEDFPEDELDRLVLKIVKSSYKTSTVVNHFVISSLQLEQINRLMDRPKNEALFQLNPNLPSGQHPSILNGKYRYERKIPIYTSGKSKGIENIGFVDYCSLVESSEIYDKLDEIEFL